MLIYSDARYIVMHDNILMLQKHIIYSDPNSSLRNHILIAVRLPRSQSEAFCESLRNDDGYFVQSQTSKYFTVRIANLSMDKTI